MLYGGLESMKKNVLDLLMDQRTRSIAICGEGGIGKTSFMRQIYNELVDNQHYKELIWVTVSSNSSVFRIQDSIAKCLGIFNREWVPGSSIEKAQLIDDELSGNKFTLFLDDLWEPIDLSSLGVPISGQNKLVFTTRSMDVATRMQADSRFEMTLLSVEESRKLFLSKVGDDYVVNDPNICKLSEIFIEKCGGLPLLLCTVGHSMANRKTAKDWLQALQDITVMEETNHAENSLLTFCFDSLPDHRIKNCLLYFSLFPEDFTVLKNDLIDFWICERLLDEDDSLEMGYNAMFTLIGAGLLEEEDDDHVKLLDMIRGIASYLAIRREVFKNGQLVDGTFENMGALIGWFSSAMPKSFFQAATIGDLFQKRANIPVKFLTFLFHHNPFIMIKGSPDVSGSNPHNSSPRKKIQTAGDLFFEVGSRIRIRNSRLYALTVLDLSYSGIEEAPKEISTLVSLQYLNLSRTWIYVLPVELKTLTKLKCLNLEYNDQLRVIPKELIYGLCALQVLKLFRCGYSVEELGDNILLVRNMDLEPLQHLKHLKVLSITITCVHALNKLFSDPKLSSCTQSLSLEIFWGSKSIDISPLAAMTNLLTFEVHQAELLEELKLNLEYSKFPSERSFGRLQKITIQQCSNLRELTWVIVASNLKALRVKDCENMVEIINRVQLGNIFGGAEEDVDPFAKLENVELESLPELKSIYWKALPFKYLKKIQVIDCSQLKKLPLNTESANPMELVIRAEEDWWKDIEWEDEDTKTTFLPCFRQSLLL